MVHHYRLSAMAMPTISEVRGWESLNRITQVVWAEPDPPRRGAQTVSSTSNFGKWKSVNSGALLRPGHLPEFRDGMIRVTKIMLQS